MTALPVLFPPAEQGLQRVSPHWYQTRDGDRCALALFMRHYSCEHPRAKLAGGAASLIIGPGEKMLLISGEGDALFAWRRELYRRDGQRGVNCAVFRNESPVLSSVLIREAMDVAWRRWPGERLFTFVNPNRVRSSNPGFCFLCAGWRKCGRSGSGLLILEVTDESA
jgi:hypothetical protein